MNNEKALFTAIMNLLFEQCQKYQLHFHLKFYSKSGQNAIVMRFCPLCLFSQLKLI